MGLTEKEETIIKEEIKRTIYLYENYFGGNPNVLNIITGNGINLHCCCLNVLVNKHNTLRQFLFLQPQISFEQRVFLVS